MRSGLRTPANRIAVGRCWYTIALYFPFLIAVPSRISMANSDFALATNFFSIRWALTKSISLLRTVYLRLTSSLSTASSRTRDTAIKSLPTNCNLFILFCVCTIVRMVCTCSWYRKMYIFVHIEELGFLSYPLSMAHILRTKDNNSNNNNRKVNSDSSRRWWTTENLFAFYSVRR